MLCAVCRHCGLCEGDQNLSSENLIVSHSLCDIEPDEHCPLCDIGIAVDIGTTTVAASAYHLQTGRFLLSKGEANAQRIYGGDVVARIAFALKDEEPLTAAIRKQVAHLCQSLYSSLAPVFLSKRMGRCRIKKITLTGNSAMLSFLAGIKVKGLSAFPFFLEDSFGFSKKASQYFSFEELSDAEVFFAPCASAFIGGDTVCAILSTFSFKDNVQFLCDAGTNCEMAVFIPDSKKIICTSSAAGPAFEGAGIECGMAAKEGALESVLIDQKKIKPRVIGGGSARGICASGILSAASAMLKEGIINRDGTFLESGLQGFNFDKSLLRFFLTDEVFISQNDIRAIQLAKSAVKTGLDFLVKHVQKQNLKNAELFLTGGFGSSMNVNDALFCSMIPKELVNVKSVLNAALHGAAILFSDDKKELALKTSRLITTINLAEEESFQKEFLKNINF